MSIDIHFELSSILNVVHKLEYKILYHIREDYEKVVLDGVSSLYIYIVLCDVRIIYGYAIYFVYENFYKINVIYAV